MDGYCDEHSAHRRAIDQHDRRLDAHGGQLDAINESLAVLKEIEQQNQERIDEINERVSRLEAAPGKRWEAAVSYVITFALALALGAVAAHAGLQ